MVNEKKRLAWGFREIAESAGLSIAFIRDEHRRGVLRARRFGKRWLVLDEDLQNYLERGSAGTPPKGEKSAAA